MPYTDAVDKLLIVKQMAESEQLKADNPTEWVGKINDIRQRVTEIANKHLIYR